MPPKKDKEKKKVRGGAARAPYPPLLRPAEPHPLHALLPRRRDGVVTQLRAHGCRQRGGCCMNAHEARSIASKLAVAIVAATCCGGSGSSKQLAFDAARALRAAAPPLGRRPAGCDEIWIVAAWKCAAMACVSP
jgi:hypothetical protein